ncbi:hypothetical protein RCL_jg21532.t1 [Rhizophagus clarus]|uniref:Uncharacterized protein n=1 Tax=Rhizophagus clarus TaxID=94130 RepID=A0A8H3L4B9_9GLOM|nr:hypothetical protein RCL_jg21532.t1 [Rhizophagus clarus]
MCPFFVKSTFVKRFFNKDFCISRRRKGRKEERRNDEFKHVVERRLDQCTNFDVQILPDPPFSNCKFLFTLGSL